MCFKVVSDLKVNFFKSAKVGIFVEGQILQDFVIIMCCKVISLPTSYLGLSFCIGSVPLTMWNTIVERVEQRLTSWKAKYLSFGRRITLIKSVLANLPIYFMSIFKCLVSIIKRIEKL